MAGGGNAIDTANAYSVWVPGHEGGGQSETVLGKWLSKRGRRNDILIFTKVGSDLGNGKKGLSKDNIKQAVEASLRRLQTDYIDLYQSHKDDESLPVTEPPEAYAKLLKGGKIRVIGASNFTPTRLQEVLDAATNGLPRCESLQPQYNLYDRADIEQKELPVVQKTNIGVIPYFGLASGFLTGKYRTRVDLEKSPRGDSVGKKYLNDRGLAILYALDTVADRHSATPAQIALAWLMQAPGIRPPLPAA